MNQTVKVLPDVLSQEVSGETVLLDLNNENYFGLNEVGTRIWQLLQEQNDLEGIYDILLDEYEVDAKQLRKDFDGIIKQLMDTGLIAIKEA
ncbi:MAG: PqqD family protein [Gammaproteobacteria bacterium]|nr:MAG: PqqD family protein [Gammaproteobacteria bacterium]RKZ71939.1 MAG: PqqD family protein [Gammaproteobacteria bacterium]